MNFTAFVSCGQTDHDNAYAQAQFRRLHTVPTVWYSVRRARNGR